MHNTLAIIQKELLRVFKDKKLVMLVILMPGLLLYVIYSFVGDAITNLENEKTKDPATVYALNMPSDFKSILDHADFDFKANYTTYTANELEHLQLELKEGRIDFIIDFGTNFLQDISQGLKPEISYYFNPSESRSEYVYTKFSNALSIYEKGLFEAKYGEVNLFTQKSEAIYFEEKAIGQGLAMMLPFLIIILLFQGAMSVAPESIAGEKERNTFATLLITPTKRRDIALGKNISLSILAILSAISSFIGILLSLPKMMGLNNVNTNIYKFGDYTLIFFVLVSTVLVIVCAISILSSLAKNVKEASMLSLPLMLISMGVGIFSMYSSSAKANNLLYFVPILNSSQSLTQILTFAVNPLQIIITIIVNILSAILMTFILTRIFSSEKIMFSK